MIDNATQLSVTTTTLSKKPKYITNTIMENWVGAYWSVDKFLFDNGEELVNNESLYLCETLSNKVHTTEAESP